jgi:hypothetical protein
LPASAVFIVDHRPDTQANAIVARAETNWSPSVAGAGR